jgi:hypothetical protein
MNRIKGRHYTIEWGIKYIAVFFLSALVTIVIGCHNRAEQSPALTQPMQSIGPAAAPPGSTRFYP